MCSVFNIFVDIPILSRMCLEKKSFVLTAISVEQTHCPTRATCLFWDKDCMVNILFLFFYFFTFLPFTDYLLLHKHLYSTVVQLKHHP